MARRPSAFVSRPDDRVREAAAAWYARLREQGDDPGLRAAFARWLTENPHHAPAFEVMGRVWECSRSGLFHPKLQALRHKTAMRLARRPR